MENVSGKGKGEGILYLHLQAQRVHVVRLPCMQRANQMKLQDALRPIRRKAGDKAWGGTCRVKAHYSADRGMPRGLQGDRAQLNPGTSGN
jgi:hypothetical protein